ncbi:MAG TPA: HAMP domain-containing histidine kinase [Gammaproteobacteria bacterium]|nr:HAMP domain-containing histidine kinase [Gammaproteobacteria bacterium]
MRRSILRRVFDLSIAHKIPLWGAALILVSTFSVATLLMYRSYGDLRASLIAGSASLGRTLAQTLIPTLLHDNIWRAFELVSAPIHDTIANNPVQPQFILVLTRKMKIFVSSDPNRFPMLTSLRQYGTAYAQLASRIAPDKIASPVVFEAPTSPYLFIAVPIVDGNTRLGTMILMHSLPALNFMFLSSSLSAALFGLLVLAILLPINWYWGYRMATPLLRLTRLMEQIQHEIPQQMELETYDYGDELGRLFSTYNQMVETLQEKAVLEHEMLSSERLAAVGRLTSGIAHEINNPLAGLLTALDTLKHRDNLDQRSQHTLGILERGMLQIKDTVAALLVEARSERRSLQARDLEDIQTLLQGQLQKQQVTLEAELTFTREVAIPAAPVRQILLNLLTNAIQAAGSSGWVKYSASCEASQFRLCVRNTGTPIAEQQLERLFEPFVSYREGGHGLGLWVTYQLVQQLGGHIEATSEDSEVRFLVVLPADEAPIDEVPVDEGTE